VPDPIPPVAGPGMPPDASMLAFVRRMREDVTRMQMEHQFAVDEVLTKVEILRRESLHLHRYNPIEHVGSRVKSPGSILDKALRRNLELSPEAIRAGITDIAGVRITCSFIADTYRVLENLTSQADVRVLTVKDYIARPKPNGYKSLHAIIEVPVFLSTGAVPITVEVQIRTIAMDFWASLEHKIHYKYHGEVPAHFVASLAEAADVAAQLDRRMEQLHREVHGDQADPQDDSTTIDGIDDQLLLRLWERSRGEPPPSTDTTAPTPGPRSQAEAG
jgi:putative GTP pyrophosphokinase